MPPRNQLVVQGREQSKKPGVGGKADLLDVSLRRYTRASSGRSAGRMAKGL